MHLQMVLESFEAPKWRQKNASLHEVFYDVMTQWQNFICGQLSYIANTILILIFFCLIIIYITLQCVWIFKTISVEEGKKWKVLQLTGNL